MKHHALQFSLFTAYMLVMTALMIWQGVGITPDRYALVLILGTLFVKKTRKFLLDWIPFIFLLISYDFLRSLTPKLNFRVHYIESFHFDQSVFGQAPTITLQNWLYHAGTLHWYDYGTTMFYFLHFALILIFGFMLWFKNLAQFRQYVLGLLLLSYTAWFTYIVFPSAPPWLASADGYIPNVNHILASTLQTFPERLHIPTIYQSFDPNQVAAIPSLHAAYPTMVLLFAWDFFGFKASFFLLYVLGACFSLVYLGEHYVIDILIGIGYAVAFFFLAKLLSHHKEILGKLSLPFRRN